MTFEEILDQAIAMLQCRGRVSYRTLTLQFHLDEESLEALKEELLEGHRLAVDHEGRMLVWAGEAHTTSAAPSPPPPQQAIQQEDQPAQVVPPAMPSAADAERRQLTVMFCDLVDSTVLAGQLDPEDLREVVRAYQETCAKVIARFEGHIAQYLGDGLLVYFGYPRAHEDDAQRAVRAGLGMVEALGQLNTRLMQERGVHLAVRLGIHTGLVVVGEVGGGTRQEQLALGETPNLAARLQGIAAPNTLVISATTFQLLGGFFACQPLGTPLLKGLAQPLAVYRVLYESMARSRLDMVGSTGLTPLVGREQEVALLLERWAQVKDGLGQVVLLSGDPTTLELLSLLVDQGPTTRLLALWTFRPDFSPPWIGRSHVTQVMLPRLPRRQAVEMTSQVARRKALPAEVIEQVVAKTDGVPLFVEELTKMVLESGLLQVAPAHQEEAEEHFQQALAVARRQQAKSWELRAALSLSRLWQQQGKRTAAYELLAPIYGWFTEGFDTADLQEARALLEALT